jgi:RNA polymerase sigma factor (sigma-70 family)
VGETPYGEALRQTRVLFEGGTVAGLSDCELLQRFATRRGDPAESAFAALVARHGPMVLRVGRSVLRDEHDADDAFQATFLVLARKADSLRVDDSVGPWLHGVALRVASTARSAGARRARHERRASEQTIRVAERPLLDDPSPVIHEEIERLPERYRSAIILCDLEGLTQEQAAARLGWPLGTVRSRLARGRERLRDRLKRRGVDTSGALAALAPGALTDAMIEATSRLIVGEKVPLAIMLLTDGGRRAMRFLRWKSLAAMLGASALVAAGACVIAASSFGQAQRGEPAKTAASPPDVAPKKDSETGAPAKKAMLTSYSFVTPAGGDKVWTYDSATKAWRVFNAPPGIRFHLMRAGEVGFGIGGWGVRLPQSITGQVSMMALGLEGKDIKEVAAFHTRTGTWSRQALRVPAQGYVRPHLSNDFAIYQLGRYLYGFSDVLGTWNVLDLGEPTEWAQKERNVFPTVSMPADARAGMIEVGRKLCAFSALTGTWDVLDVEPVSTGPHVMRMFTLSEMTYLPIGDRLVFFDAERGKFRDVDPVENPKPPR